VVHFYNPLLDRSLSSFWFFGNWVWLGLNWLCFPGLRKCHFFHNPLLILNLRSFEYPANWVCFGFVFIGIVHSYLFVVHCYNSIYVHLNIQQIGFVLHKRVDLSRILDRCKGPRLAKSEIRSTKSSVGHLTVETISKSKWPKLKTLPFLPNNDFLRVSADTKTCGWPLYPSPAGEHGGILTYF